MPAPQQALHYDYAYFCARCGAGTPIKLPGRTPDEIFCPECTIERFRLQDHALDLFEMVKEFHQLAEYLTEALPPPPEQPSDEPSPAEGLAAWARLLKAQSAELIGEVEVSKHESARKLQIM